MKTSSPLSRWSLPCVLSVMVLLAGCKPGPLISVGVDCSGSTAAARDAQIKLLLMLVEYSPADATLSLWRFARDTQKVWEGQALTAEQILAVAKKELAPTVGGKGTCPGGLLEALASQVAGHQRDSYVVLLWDGENTGPSMASAISELAAQSNLKALWITGVPPEARLNVEREFAPLGDRLVVSGMADRESGYARFSQHM